MANLTMSAEERASEIVASLEAEFNVKIPLSWETGVANDIRHAEQAKEQAAYERGRWEAFEEVTAWTDWASYPELCKELQRALAQQPEEVG